MAGWMQAAGMFCAAGLVATPLALSANGSAPAAPAARSVPAAIAETAGKLLDRQPLAANLGLESAARAYAIRYTSTNGVTGSGTLPVTGALFIPKGAMPEGGWPLIAWAHGTVGIGDGCAPSRNPRSTRDRTYLNHWLDEGYAIVATDYQGLGTPGPHPYLNSRAAAYSTLDAVRAVLGEDLDLANKVLLVGQSQGAGAAFATAGYAPGYAPEIDLRGTIATGIPNLAATSSSSADAGSGTSADEVSDHVIAYLMYIAAAAQQIDPEYDPEAVFTDRALPVLSQAADTCVGDMFRTVTDAGLTGASTFKSDFLRYYAPMLAHARYPTLDIATPVFIGTGAEDVDTPAALQTALVNSACAAGSTIEAHVYPGIGHSATVNRSFTDSRIFAQRVMAGQPIAPTCSVSGA